MDDRLVDLDGCRSLLGLTVRQLRKLQRGTDFPEPAGQDGGSFWREHDVWEWAARQGQPLAGRVPLRFWPQAQEPAEYLGAVRLVRKHVHDDVALRWRTTAGVIAVVWRPDDAIMMRLDELDDVASDAVVGVDPDFGVYGPGVRSLSRGRGEEDGLCWPELAQVLGQPVPYWPYLLRDPDLIEMWEPNAATVIAPARTDLDTGPLLRMAAMFDPTHATNRTLTNLVRVNQGRASRDALHDLELAAENVQHWTDQHQQPAVMVVAAEPLVIGEVNADPDDIDDTVQRIGWIELLGRTDTLSWACVKQALAWDGGKHFPFSSPAEIDPTSAPAREWAARLEPAKARTAEFACINRDGAGDAVVDPLTGAPAVRLPDGMVTIVPQRLPTTSPLAEVILGRPIWIRTADGTLYPAPQRRLGMTWGYGGTGPGVLARLIHRLLDDITAEPADGTTGAPRGLVELTRMKWPTGVVLSRALLEAARDGRPYDHPAKPG